LPKNHCGTSRNEPEQAKQASDEVEAGNLFDRLKALNRTTLDILREARESRNPGVALQAIARAEKQLDLECRLLGELKDAGIDYQALPVEMTEDEQNL
jgi:hypothetical protein